METAKEIVTYLDSYGTKYSFFTDRKPRLYTPFGGILTIITILIILIVLIFHTRDDLRRLKPENLFSSVLSEEYKEINVTKEKIWIPWRIVDYNNDFVNHTELIYPKIYYYERNRTSFNDSFSLKYKLLNYKLCNETSMKYKPDFYYINVPLDKLYCIDMENYNMGGSWISLFLKYLKIDFYLCEDGIDFDENNQKCTTYEKIHNYIGYKNSLKIEFFYPDVQFQPTNKNKSISVLYKQHFYHISKYSNKIDRLYLRNYILSDEKGWFNSKIINSSYWGYYSLSGDSYITRDVKDIINEGSTSRVYSLNIYLESDVINFSRTYKKLLVILVQSFPILYITLFFCKTIATILKIAEKKKKMIEMLFENLQKKVRRIFTPNHRNNKTKSSNMRCNYYSSNKIRHRENIINNNLHFLNENKYSNVDNNNNSHINNCSNNSNIMDNSKNCIFSNLIIKQNEYKTDIPQNEQMEVIENIKNSNQNAKQISGNCQQINNISNPQSYNNSSKILPKKDDLQEGKFEKMENMANEFYYIKKVKGKKLFPYYYYFLSAFIKSIDITKRHFCLSSKYIGVHTFICQMFDVSSYLQLFRQFQLVKSWLFKDNINLIERDKKLDMNARNFNRNMYKCINNKNFVILTNNT